MVERGLAWLTREGVHEAQRRLDVTIDLRYAGQAFEIALPVALPLNSLALNGLADTFHGEHKRRYGFDQPNARVEIVTLRVTVIGQLPKLTFAAQDIGGPDPRAAKIDVHQVYLDGAYHQADIYDRMQLQPGNRLHGPAIIVQPDCTTLALPGQVVSVDGFGNLLIEG